MAVLWLTGGVPKIKELPDDEINRRLERIKPLKTIDGTLHRFITSHTSRPMTGVRSRCGTRPSCGALRC